MIDLMDLCFLEWSTCQIDMIMRTVEQARPREKFKNLENGAVASLKSIHRENLRNAQIFKGQF